MVSDITRSTAFSPNALRPLQRVRPITILLLSYLPKFDDTLRDRLETYYEEIAVTALLNRGQTD